MAYDFNSCGHLGGSCGWSLWIGNCLRLGISRGVAGYLTGQSLEGTVSGLAILFMPVGCPKRRFPIEESALVG